MFAKLTRTAAGETLVNPDKVRMLEGCPSVRGDGRGTAITFDDGWRMEVRESLSDVAIRLARAVADRSAGLVRPSDLGGGE